MGNDYPCNYLNRHAVEREQPYCSLQISKFCCRSLWKKIVNLTILSSLWGHQKFSLRQLMAPPVTQSCQIDDILFPLVPCKNKPRITDPLHGNVTRQDKVSLRVVIPNKQIKIRSNYLVWRFCRLSHRRRKFASNTCKIPLWFGTTNMSNYREYLNIGCPRSLVKQTLGTYFHHLEGN